MKKDTLSNLHSTSCFQEESLLIKAPVGKIWDLFKEFKWEKLCPTKIKSCKFLTGNPLQIGSTYKLETERGCSFTYMIVELSELKRKFSVELIECEPKENFSSMLTMFKLNRITEDNTTLLTWQTLFSNDVSVDTLNKRKEIVKGYFSDLKRLAA